MNKKIGLLIVAQLIALSLSCQRQTPPQERARITVDRVEVKKTRATLSTVVAQLQRGDEIEVLSRESHWLRVRTKNGQQGWIEESAALNQTIVDAEKKLAGETQSEIVQAVGEISSGANLHIEPGRETPVFTRLPKGEAVQIFDRTLTTRSPSPASSNPNPASPLSAPRKDAWLKVRTAQGIAGWVYSPSVNFDVPETIAQYAESRRIVAWLVLNQVEAEGGKKINQYVVADVTPGTSPEYDFDRIRVFTWNKSRNRYETAFRNNKIFGVYPLRVFTHENKPAFEVTRWSEAESKAPKVTERYFMNGVLVRRIDADKRSHAENFPRRRKR